MLSDGVDHPGGPARVLGFSAVLLVPMLPRGAALGAIGLGWAGR